MPITTQHVTVPDVGIGPGPFPSPAWIPGTLSKLTRIGWGPGTTQADIVRVIVSATGTDPIDESNPNVLGVFYGNQGSQAPDLIHASACPFFAFLRYTPPPGAGIPMPIASFIFQGTS